jgi:hypothetical protein
MITCQKKKETRMGMAEEILDEIVARRPTKVQYNS